MTSNVAVEETKIFIEIYEIQTYHIHIIYFIGNGTKKKM